MRGPIFANVLLADEINRTPPKTQAALLEAMQEHHVTAGGRDYPLEQPFFVLATQNPIEQEGTYPLPEAQLDRFMFNIVMDYLSEDDEVRVVTGTTGTGGVKPSRVFSGADIEAFQQVVRHVAVSDEVARYTVRLVDASRPTRPHARDFVKKWVKWGAGPARLAGADPRRQGAGAAGRPLPRLGRRHPGPGALGAAAPHHHVVLRRRRADHAGRRDRAAHRGRAGPQERTLRAR